MQALSFRIEGAWLTQHLRNLIIQGDWVMAQRFISESFPEMTNAQTQGLLMGKLELRGTNELELVEAPTGNTDQLRALVAELHAGTLMCPELQLGKARSSQKQRWQVIESGLISARQRQLQLDWPDKVNDLEQGLKMSIWTTEGFIQILEEVNDLEGIQTWVEKGSEQGNRYILMERAEGTAQPPPWWPDLEAQSPTEWLQGEEIRRRKNDPGSSRLGFDEGWAQEGSDA